MNFGRIPEPVKREFATIVLVRTENQYRCCWLKMPRCVGLNQVREFGKLVA